MDIVAYKSAGHDGAICCIRDGRLLYSIEGEKDSRARHAPLPRTDFDEVLTRWSTKPDVACGDSLEPFGDTLSYFGVAPEDVKVHRTALDGATLDYFSIPHELCHVAGAFAMSDIPEGQPFYALIWEGVVGRLYHVDASFRIQKLGTGRPLANPAAGDHILGQAGVRYSFAYHGTGRTSLGRLDAAGKVMALAGLTRSRSPADDGERALLSYLLDATLTGEKDADGQFRVVLNGDPDALTRRLAHLNGQEVDSPDFTRLCWLLQEAIFDRFYDYARRHVTDKLPLVIGGGCGLNCEWNTRWREAGLFDSVFVPPVANDSGIAIGAAAAAQRLRTGRTKIEWNVYAGEELVDDATPADMDGFVEMPLDLSRLCEGIHQREWVVAWVHGRYEMGPRALCHRSLIAAPFNSSMKDRLNRIKRREYFRPVAPVCLEEDVSEHFDWSGPSPFMLYFHRVRSQNLSAITHLDGTARVQTLSEREDPLTHRLLREFKRQTGYGVLCNTSLNHPGKGFINHTSDLFRYCKAVELPAVVVNDRMYVHTSQV